MFAKESLYPHSIMFACRSDFQQCEFIKDCSLLTSQYNKGHAVSAPLERLHGSEASLLPHPPRALVELGYGDVKRGRRKRAAGEIKDGVDVR